MLLIITDVIETIDNIQITDNHWNFIDVPNYHGPENKLSMLSIIIDAVEIIDVIDNTQIIDNYWNFIDVPNYHATQIKLSMLSKIIDDIDNY